MERLGLRVDLREPRGTAVSCQFGLELMLRLEDEGLLTFHDSIATFGIFPKTSASCWTSAKHSTLFPTAFSCTSWQDTDWMGGL